MDQPTSPQLDEPTCTPEPKTTTTRDLFVSLEMDTGEGFVVRVENVPTFVPIYHRWYRNPEEGFLYDTSALELVLLTLETPRVAELMEHTEGEVISIQAVEAREQSEDLRGMTWEEGVQWALDNNFVIRKVVEDGNAHIVTMDLNMNRWSCHLAYGVIYRAERY